MCSYLQKTVKIQPNYALAFFSLGNLYVDLKDYESAVSNYQKAAELTFTGRKISSEEALELGLVIKKVEKETGGSLRR